EANLQRFDRMSRNDTCDITHAALHERQWDDEAKHQIGALLARGSLALGGRGLARVPPSTPKTSSVIRKALQPKAALWATRSQSRRCTSKRNQPPAPASSASTVAIDTTRGRYKPAAGAIPNAIIVAIVASSGCCAAIGSGWPSVASVRTPMA